MSSRALIDEFLAQKKLALVRPSSSTPVRGVKIDEELAGKGYEVSVAYLEDASPERKVSGLKQPVEGVIIAVAREQSEEAVRGALEAQIPRIWLQKGCESRQAIDLCEQTGTPLVHDECVLMYAEPVKSFHAFHRWIWKTLGKLAT